MKKNFFIGMAAVAALLGSASCNKEQAAQQETQNETAGESILTLSLDNGTLPSTRSAEVDSLPEGKEDVLKDVQFFIFNDESFEKYIHISDWDSLAKASGSLKINVKNGFKEILVVCNGPDLSDKSEVDDVRGTIMELSAYNDPDSDFFMYGEDEFDLAASQNVSKSIRVSRVISKIYIAQVKNNLPPQFGDIQLNYAFLTNVPSKVDVSGTVMTDSTWYNRYGRASETPLVKDHIIDGTTYIADAPKLTFNNYSNATIERGDSLSTKKTFYCLPHSFTNVINTFSTTFTKSCTKVVIVATINGEKYYYAVNMGLIERNTVYALYLTVSGLGSTDPATSVTKGSIESTISVIAWHKATAIEENI